MKTIAHLTRMTGLTGLTGLALAACIPPAIAQDATASLPAVRVEAVRYVVDCRHRSLPSQRQVGEWTGQDNFAQAYDTREQLMADIGRACKRAGDARVRVVARAAADRNGTRLVAALARPGT